MIFAPIILLEFSFSNIEVREICESSEKAAEELGEEGRIHLQLILADLRAAENVYQSPLAEIVECEKGIEIISEGTIKLIAQAGHLKVPKKSNGSIDWETVNRLKIIEVHLIT